MKPLVYLAGPWNEYEDNWKETFKKLDQFKFYDPEIRSDQSGDFTKDDLSNIKKSYYLIANPGTTPAEATWAEIGYFYALNTRISGELCKKLIIVWSESREPKWSLDFIKKLGVVVRNLEEAKNELTSRHLQARE